MWGGGWSTDNKPSRKRHWKFLHKGKKGKGKIRNQKKKEKIILKNNGLIG